MRLLSGFRVVSNELCDQGGDEDAEERFSLATDVVDELDEAEVGRKLLLGDAAVRLEPGAR